MRPRPIIAAILFGVAMNYIAAWFCVQRHQAAIDEYQAKIVSPPMVFMWGRATPAPLRTVYLPSMWPATPPKDWPTVPTNVFAEQFHGIQETYAFAPGLQVTDSNKDMIRTDAGWPFRSVWTSWNFFCVGKTQVVMSLPLPAKARHWSGINALPIGISPLPFVANTLIYAALAWSAWTLPAFLRTRRRSRLHLCPTCAYPIGTSPLCTECGHPVQPLLPTTQPL